MPYYSKRRARKARSPNNATWVPINGYSADYPPYTDGEWITLSQTQMTNVLQIAPMIQAEDDTGLGSFITPLANMRPAVPKVMRFDGSIFCALPVKKFATVDSSYVDRPVHVFWAWRRIDATPQDTAYAVDQMDPTEASEEGYRVFSERGHGAILRWGQFFLEREYRTTWGRGLQAQVATANSQVWPASQDQEWAQCLTGKGMRKIPFPRLGRAGLGLGRNQVLRLEMIANGVGFASSVATNMDMKQSLGTEQAGVVPQVFPMFRYLLSWDDR